MLRAPKIAPVRIRTVTTAVRAALAAAVVAVGVFALPVSAGHSADVPVVHGGELRSYRLYVPGSLEAGRRVPLLLVLHGLGGSGVGMARTTSLDALAEREGFVVAYPDGLWRSWNAGTCCGDASAAGVDDVGFLARIVSDLTLTLPLDPARVYAAGFSNGGMMALRAACERPDVFAAVASVTGTLEAPCAPARPVSVLQVAGGRDGTVPYRGLRWSAFLKTAITPVPVASGTFERGGLCSGLPARARTAKTDLRTYDRCAGGSAVRVVLLPEMGHVWPTKAREGWSGSDEVWRFLSARRVASATDRPRPVLTTRIVAARVGRDVDGRLDGRYDVVIGRRVNVDVLRGSAWVPWSSVTTDVEGRFRFAAPDRAVRLRYAGAPGLPSTATVA